MKNSALLVIDLQNDFTLPDGKAPACITEVNEIFPAVNAVTAHWQAVDSPVIVVTTRWNSWLMRIVTRNSVAPSTVGAELDARLAVTATATFQKSARSMFTSKELADFLKQHGITELVLCGLAAEYCITASAIEAMKQGYSVSLLTDAIASYKAGGKLSVFNSLSAKGAKLITAASISSR